jgi:hypothetical protein
MVDPVVIDLDTQPAGLRWGMSAETQIQVEWTICR